MTFPQIITTTNKRVMSLSDHYRQTLNGMIPPNKGEMYQGGFYIADITYGDGRKFGIILSPKSGGETLTQWKSSNTITNGTDSYDDGFANSESMMVVGPIHHTVGNFCRTLSIGGYTDWYLPARNELTTIWNFRTNIPSGEEFEMSVTYYWTSTQGGSPYSASYCRNFDTGVETQKIKGDHLYVRAIRRFPLN